MEELIKDYEDNLFTIKELSQKYHIGQDKVRKILREKDIYIRTKEESLILRKNKGYTLSQIEDKVVYNYTIKQYGQLKSGKEFGISASKVKKILLKHNIPIRDLHTAIGIANQTNDRTTQHYQKDINFFKNETSDMAWLLGFLASDGNVSKNSNRIRIELSYVDREILEKIKKLVKIDNPIYERENKNGFKFVSLEWSCKEHKEDLAQYGIIPNKTYVLKPPLKLSPHFYIDYIRGYFDGDGTINLNHCQHGNALRWGICGASKPMLQWIVQILNEQYKIPPVNLHKDSSHDTDFYSITYSTCAARNIYNILYTPNSIYLNRKKEKYQSLLKEVPCKE